MSNDAIVATVISVASSLVFISIAWGIMKSKVDRLEKDNDENEKRYVTLEQWKASIRPLRDEVAQMRNDIRTILAIVTKSHRSQDD